MLDRTLSTGDLDRGRFWGFGGILLNYENGLTTWSADGGLHAAFDDKFD